MKINLMSDVRFVLKSIQVMYLKFLNKMLDIRIASKE